LRLSLVQLKLSQTVDPAPEIMMTTDVTDDTKSGLEDNESMTPWIKLLTIAAV